MLNFNFLDSDQDQWNYNSVKIGDNYSTFQRSKFEWVCCSTVQYIPNANVCQVQKQIFLKIKAMLWKAYWAPSCQLFKHTEKCLKKQKSCENAACNLFNKPVTQKNDQGR